MYFGVLKDLLLRRKKISNSNQNIFYIEHYLKELWEILELVKLFVIALESLSSEHWIFQLQGVKLKEKKKSQYEFVAQIEQFS